MSSIKRREFRKRAQKCQQPKSLVKKTIQGKIKRKTGLILAGERYKS